MSLAKLRALTIGLLFLLAPAQASAHETLDAFVAAVQTAANAGGDYTAIVEAIDPEGRQTATLQQLAAGLHKVFGGAPLTFDVLFRVDSSDKGARIIGTLWRENTYLYVVFIMHRRPEGWTPIQTTVQSNYAGVLPYQ